ncbi:hypothetical protein VSP96_15755, partial [Escherichia coli]
WLQPCLLKIYSHMVTFWGNYEGISQGEVANLRVTFSIRRPSGKEINQTVGFAPFGLNRLNISFTDYLFGSFTSNSSLILYKPEFERKSCATVRTTIVAATATINGKDVELLKAGAIEQKW